MSDTMYLFKRFIFLIMKLLIHSGFKKKQDAGCLPIFAFITFFDKVSQILVSNTNAGIAATFLKLRGRKLHNVELFSTKVVCRSSLHS